MRLKDAHMTKKVKADKFRLVQFKLSHVVALHDTLKNNNQSMS